MRTETIYLDKENNRTTKEKAWTVTTRVYNDAGHLQRTGVNAGEAQIKAARAGRTVELKLTAAETGKTVTLNRNVVKAGRDEKCDLVIGNGSDKKLEKIHAMFELRQGAWFVTDLSKTGTFVNGERLAPNVPRELHTGDTVSFAGRAEYTVG